MLDYMHMGRTPAKHHITFRRDDGALYQEHCFTRKGFDEVYSILYHVHPPTMEQEVVTSTRFAPEPGPVEDLQPHLHTLKRRHYRTGAVADATGESLLHARRLLMVNDDCGLSVARPTAGGDYFFANNDGDDLYFVYEGSGVVETPFGLLRFEKDDYVWIPRSCLSRWRFDTQDNFLFITEARGGLEIPQNFRNPGGQLKLDAPYSHRDFTRPHALAWDGSSPLEDRVTVVTKKMGHYVEHEMSHSPLDVVGWDGYVYPIAFNARKYQAKAGLVHLPPPIHTTFLARGFVVCTFVPRMVDFHPEAIPCPYAHSSVDCDEILFYVSGDFTSRRGVDETSITLHPAGLPHGPHPGAYAASVGTRETHELAVMVDTFKPLFPTRHAVDVEDADYHKSWLLDG